MFALIIFSHAGFGAYSVYRRHNMDRLPLTGALLSSELMSNLPNGLTTFATIGESEPVSFVIRPSNALANVVISVTDLVSGTDIINSTNVVIRRVCYQAVNVRQKITYVTLGRTLLSEHDHPQGFACNANENSWFWLTILVPLSAKNGTYQATVTVAPTGGEAVTTFPLKVEVLPFRLDPLEDGDNNKHLGFDWAAPTSKYMTEADPLFWDMCDAQFEDIANHGFAVHPAIGYSAWGVQYNVLAEPMTGTFTKLELLMSHMRKYDKTSPIDFHSFWQSHTKWEIGDNYAWFEGDGVTPNPVFLAKFDEEIDLCKAEWAAHPDWPPLYAQVWDEPCVFVPADSVPKAIMLAEELLKKGMKPSTHVIDFNSQNKSKSSYGANVLAGRLSHGLMNWDQVNTTTTFSILYHSSGTCQPWFYNVSRIFHITDTANTAYGATENIKGSERIAHGFFYWKYPMCKNLSDWMYNGDEGTAETGRITLTSYKDSQVPGIGSGSLPIIENNIARVVPVLDWEWQKEGVDDLKYLYTLQHLIDAANTSGDPTKIGNAATAEAVVTAIMNSMDDNYIDLRRKNLVEGYSGTMVGSRWPVYKFDENRRKVVDQILILLPDNMPGTPVQSAPADGLSISYSTPTFDWSDSVNSLTYGIQVSTMPDFSVSTINLDSAVSQYVVTGSGLSNGVYYWRVRGKNGALSGEWSSSMQFSVSVGVVVVAPPIPTLISPANTTTISYSTPTFDWTSETGAASYTLQISTMADFSVLNTNTSPSASAYTLPGSLSNATYYWRVRSNGAASSNWSSSYQVTVAVIPPSIPVPSYPIDASVITYSTPTFDWANSTGAISYTLQVSTVSNFSLLKFDQAITDSQYIVTLNNLLNNATHYWKVRSSNGSIFSDWSSVMTFAVSNNDIPIYKNSPSNNEQVSTTTPSFDWNDVDGATVYQIQISSISALDFTSTVVNIDTITISYLDLDTKLGYLDYFWRVRANVDSAWRSWSSVSTFTVLPETVVFTWGNLRITNTKGDWLASGNITDNVVPDVKMNVKVNVGSLKTGFDALIPVANTLSIFSFDEGMGDRGVGDQMPADGSTNNQVTSFKGVYTGDVPLNAINFGTCFRTNGINDYIYISSFIALSNRSELTIGAWIKPDGTPSGKHQIIQRGNDDWGLYSSGGRIYFYVDTTNSGGSYKEISAPIQLTWTLIEGTYDGTAMKLYKNGGLAVTGAQTGNINENMSNTKFTIGAGNGGTEEFFKGSIDEARVVNDCLSEYQIASDYHSEMYQYSRNGGQLWSPWIPSDNESKGGFMDVDIKAVSVPFNKASGTDNLMRFLIADMIGNISVSSPVVISTQRLSSRNNLVPAVSTIKNKIFTPNNDNKNDSVVIYLTNTTGARGEVYDMTGRRVRGELSVNAALNTVSWNGKNDNGVTVEAGTYIYKIKVGDTVLTGIIVVAR